jgi:hypothetical protein
MPQMPPPSATNARFSPAPVPSAAANMATPPSVAAQTVSIIPAFCERN